MNKFTSALNILGTGLHVTLCFCDTDNKSGKLRTGQGSGLGLVTAIEYWEKPDITVEIIESDFVIERHEYYKSLGYTYDLDFIPHATLQKGNFCERWEYKIGAKIILHDEYARIM